MTCVKHITANFVGKVSDWESRSSAIECWVCTVVEYGINWKWKWKFYLASPCEILPIFNVTLVVFIPNFTATHAITSTNNSPTNKFMENCYGFEYENGCSNKDRCGWWIGNKELVNASLRFLWQMSCYWISINNWDWILESHPYGHTWNN